LGIGRQKTFIMVAGRKPLDAYPRHHSIRINDQWRIVFRWSAGEAHSVRIVDYHS